MIWSIEFQPGQDSSVKKSTLPQTKSIIQGKLDSNSFQKTQQQYTLCQQLEDIPSSQYEPTWCTAGLRGGLTRRESWHTETFIDALGSSAQTAAS